MEAQDWCVGGFFAGGSLGRLGFETKTLCEIQQLNTEHFT